MDFAEEVCTRPNHVTHSTQINKNPTPPQAEAPTPPDAAAAAAPTPASAVVSTRSLTSFAPRALLRKGKMAAAAAAVPGGRLAAPVPVLGVERGDGGETRDGEGQEGPKLSNDDFRRLMLGGK